MRSICLLVGLLLAAAPASAQCTLSGPVSLMEVRIDVPGGTPFDVDLEQQELAVTLGADARATLEGRGALAFTGSVAREAVHVALARATRAGPLLLRPGTEIEAATLAEGGARAHVRLMEGVHAVVALPCRALRLGPTGDAPTAPADAPERGELVTTARTLRVHRTPAGRGSILIEMEQDELRLAEVGRSDGWVHVRRDFFDGATLDGWVRQSAVRSVEPAEFTETLWGTHIGSSGGCGHGVMHAYHGPATLRAGASVLVEPSGAAWARAQRHVEVQVLWRADEAWVAIEQVEGLRSREGCPMIFTRAHVRREDVILP